MEIIKTSIKDLCIIQPKVFRDERGYFMETFKEALFKENFSKVNFIQDNESKSTYGVLRGLHFQRPPFEQSKLVRVVDGEILDVAVDLRPGSSSFGKFHSEILSTENKKQLFIPKGFAHGFVVLSSTAIVNYKVDQIYSPDHETGINYNDETLNIDWRIPYNDLIVSKKDKKLPMIKNFEFKNLSI